MNTKAPAYLGKDGKRKWKELLGQLGTLRDAEYDALGLLCASWETYLIALADVRANGTVFQPGATGGRSNGRMFVNPNVNVMNEAWKQIVKLSKAFGLTPDGGAEEDDGDDDFAGLVGG